MADVEKININSTNYDIVDAKALRTKDTLGENSFVDRNAGNTSYPTESVNLSRTFIVGYSARFTGALTSAYQDITAVGYNAQIFGSKTTAIGASARATANYSTALGCAAQAVSNYSVAVGYSAAASGLNTIAIGYNANTTSAYSISIGSTTSSASGSTVVVGFSSSVGSNSTNSTAIGRSAVIGNNASNACQIGVGTNSKPGTLQFRSWQLLDNNGKIPLARIPDGVQFAVDNLPTVRPTENTPRLAVLYKGETIKDEENEDVIIQDLCYRTKINYSKPSFCCVWVYEDYFPDGNKDLVYIDQQKLFLKLAEVSQQRVDDDDIPNSIVGGAIASLQLMYLYYDPSTQEWRIEFDSSSIESADTQTPDEITGITDPREWGIYIDFSKVTLPEEEEVDFLDIEYNAPIFCDNFDYGDNTFIIDYMKFMDAMCDSEYGFGIDIPDLQSWEYEADGTTHYIPLLPKSSYNSGVSVDISWNNNAEMWNIYINQIDVGTWTTEGLGTTFGIYVESGEEENVDYITFNWKPAIQVSWEQFNPITAAINITYNAVEEELTIS